MSTAGVEVEAQRAKWREASARSRANRLDYCRARDAAHARTPDQRKYRREYAKKYRSNPEVWAKHIARTYVAKAVLRGKLIRPDACSRCESTPPPEHDGRSPIHFHHTHGYALENRLVGLWLCRRCHDEVEAKGVAS